MTLAHNRVSGNSPLNFILFCKGPADLEKAEADSERDSIFGIPSEKTNEEEGLEPDIKNILVMLEQYKLELMIILPQISQQVV